VDYDQHLCSFREWDRTFSLTLLHSRERLAPALGDTRRDGSRAAYPPVPRWPSAVVAYKAQGAGVPLVLVDPASTSQTCHLCGHRGHRSGLKFSCTHCNVVIAANWNAAMNIAAAGAAVTRLEDAPHGSVKAAAL